jgi:pilus assembly protein CpaB
MNKRAFWMLGLALLFATLAVLAAQSFLNRPAVVTKEPTTPVVVVKTRLAFGTAIEKEYLRVAAWPTANVPRGSFQKIEDVVRGDEKRVALQPVELDEPLLESKVSGFGGRASLSTVIDPTMRASTIRVNDVNGVAGFVLPGDRVDVLLTRDPESNSARATRGGELVTDILLQNVKVLAIDQVADVKKDTPSVAKAVTLEVDPTQAQKLVLAQQVGTLSLALRNITNEKAVNPQTIRLRDLGGDLPAVAPQPEAKLVVEKKPAPVVHRPSVTVFRALKPFDYEVSPERASRATNAPTSLRPSAPVQRRPEVDADQPPANEKQSAPAQPLRLGGQVSAASAPNASTTTED